MINDDSINDSIKEPTITRQNVLNHDLFETKSISTQKIKQIFEKKLEKILHRHTRKIKNQKNEPNYHFDFGSSC